MNEKKNVEVAFLTDCSRPEGREIVVVDFKLSVSICVLKTYLAGCLCINTCCVAHEKIN